MAGFGGLQGLAQGAGIAQGLAQGMQSYMQTRSALTDQAIKQKLANAQGVDAYSKLLQNLYPDQANQVARAFGLVSGGGNLLPGDTFQPQQSPQNPITENDPSHSGQNLNAPPGGERIDNASLSPTASGGFTGSGASLTQEQARSAGLAPPQYRQFNLEQIEKDADLKRQEAHELWQQNNLQSDLYGSRSPNKVLTEEYDRQAQPARDSQRSMNQMIDNYNHPSPQGDASLLLNAYKIKFPGAPDVNSLDELSTSQAAPDQFRQLANKVLAGGLDQNTRDNIMRDGISTFRANVDSLRGYQERTQMRQRAQGVRDNSITAEPAIDQTYKAAMGLQKKIGPYVPPAQRSGGGGGLLGAAAGFLGLGQPNASAAPPAPPHGQSVKQNGSIFDWDGTKYVRRKSGF